MLTAAIGAVTAVALARVARSRGARSRISRSRISRPRLSPNRSGDRAGRGPAHLLGAARTVWIPADVRRWLESALARADLTVSVNEAVMCWAAATAACGSLGLAFGGPGGAVMGLGFGLAVPPVGLWMARQRRQQRLMSALPELLEEVARDIRAGGTVRSALDRVALSPTLVGTEMATVRRRTTLGRGLDDALASWSNSHARGSASAAVGCAAAGLQVSLVTGGRAALPLEGLAASMRDRARVAADARAHAAQGRLSAWLLGVLPVASLVLSALLDPGSSSALIRHPLGRMCLAAGLALEVAGLLWMRRIVRVTA